MKSHTIETRFFFKLDSTGIKLNLKSVRVYMIRQKEKNYKLMLVGHGKGTSR